jgi:lipopolysaccharide export system ATP-binding protein
MAELIIQNLRKSYNNKVVVKDISLNVKSGEVVGLLGPNGAGKTTSFYMIVGLVAAENGTIKIDQNELTKMPIHKRSKIGISYLPQEPSIFRKMTVRENILAVLELGSYSRIKINEKVQDLLKSLSIEHIKDSAAISLSGGERRRVEIARCLATDPKFILLDEPFAGIDPIAVLDIQKIITQLTLLGIGVLITDHNVRETLGICDRAYIVNQGEVLASGTPSEMVANEAVKNIYLGKNFVL